MKPREDWIHYEKKISPSQTKGGLILLEREDSVWGRVLAVGPDCAVRVGSLILMEEGKALSLGQGQGMVRERWVYAEVEG